MIRGGLSHIECIEEMVDRGICLRQTNEPLVLLLPDDHSRRNVKNARPYERPTLMCRGRLQYSRDGHSADHEVIFNGNGYVTLDARVNFNSNYFKKCLEYTLQK